MHNVVVVSLFFFQMVTLQKDFADTEVAEVEVVTVV